MGTTEQKHSSEDTKPGKGACILGPDYLVYEALAHLQGVQALAIQIDKSKLDGLTGWQLFQMLEPVAKRTIQALEQMGWDPEIIKT